MTPEPKNKTYIHNKANDVESFVFRSGIAAITVCGYKASTIIEETKPLAKHLHISETADSAASLAAWVVPLFAGAYMLGRLERKLALFASNIGLVKSMIGRENVAQVQDELRARIARKVQPKQ